MLPGDLAKVSVIGCALRDGPRAYAHGVDVPGDGLALVLSNVRSRSTSYVFVLYRGMFGWVHWRSLEAL